MELTIILVIVIGLGWVFRKTLKEWADRAEQVSSVTSNEVFVDIEERNAALDDRITDQLINKSSSAKVKLAALKAGATLD